MAITPFKVTDFGINRKPIWDVLLVIKTNLHPSLHHFQVIADYWSDFRFWRWGTCLNTLVRREPQLRTTKFGFKKLEILLYRMVLIIWRPIILFCHHPHIWQTDRETDRCWQQECSLLTCIDKVAIAMHCNLRPPNILQLILAHNVSSCNFDSSITSTDRWYTHVIVPSWF